MLYKFLKDGKQINSAFAEYEEKAAKICGLSKGDYDSVETEETTESPNPAPSRKPRSDKGQPHKKETQTKSRKKPDYFILKHGELSGPMPHDKALRELNTWLGAGEAEPRIIMGREVSFTRQISFHIK